MGIFKKAEISKPQTSVMKRQLKDDEYRQIIERIAKFIDVTKWESQLAGFQIGFVSKNRRFVKMAERNAGQDLEIKRNTRQLGRNEREMECVYTMLLNKNKQLYRMQVAVIVKVFSDRSRVTSLYDNQIQDICNLVTLGYLKKNYPDIHTLFTKSLDVPTAKCIEDRLREQIQFDMETSEEFCLHGCMLVHKDTSWSVPITDTNKMLGDTFHFRKKVMMS